METTSAKIEYMDAHSTFSNRFRKKNEVLLEMRETFIEMCKQLCTVTTVAKYKILKGRLEEMAEIVPTLYSWIEWWNDRRPTYLALTEVGAFWDVTCPNREMPSGSQPTQCGLCMMHAMKLVA